MDGGGESAPAIPLVPANEAAAFAALLTPGLQTADTDLKALDPVNFVTLDVPCLAKAETDEMIDALAATNRATARGITMRLPVVNPLVIHIEAIQEPLVRANISDNVDTQMSGAEPLETIDTDMNTELLPNLVSALPAEPAPLANQIQTADVQSVISIPSDAPVAIEESAILHDDAALPISDAPKAIVFADKLIEPGRPNLPTDTFPQPNGTERVYPSSDRPDHLMAQPLKTPAPQPQIVVLPVQIMSLDQIRTQKIQDAELKPQTLQETHTRVAHSNDLPVATPEAAVPPENIETITQQESPEGQAETKTQLLADATRLDAIAMAFRDLVSSPTGQQIEHLSETPEDNQTPLPAQPLPRERIQDGFREAVQETPFVRPVALQHGTKASDVLDERSHPDINQTLALTPKDPSPNNVGAVISLPQQAEGTHANRMPDAREPSQHPHRNQEMTQDFDRDPRDSQSQNEREQIAGREENETKTETLGAATNDKSLREEFRNVLKAIEIKTEPKLEGLKSVNPEPAPPQSDGQNMTLPRAIAGDDHFPTMSQTGNPESRAQANELRMRALERQIVNAVKEGSDTIRMQLYPPGLGQVVIRLTAEGGRLRMISRTQSQDATDALRQVEHDLRNALGNDGIQLTEFDVSDHHDGDGRRQPQDAKPFINRSAKAESFAIDMNA